MRAVVNSVLAGCQLYYCGVCGGCMLYSAAVPAPIP